MRARDRRLGRVKDAIDASPVRRHLLREAYAWFRDFGELPDDNHIAYEVVQQALRGGEEAPLADDIPYYQRERPEEQLPPSVRAMLFDEALHAEPPLRNVARAAISAEVAWGGDVANPAFGARHGIPAYGSVAIHVLGWPKKLVLPPYEDQAERLFVRLDKVRGRIDHDDPRWFDAQAMAVVKFRQTGELPANDLHREAVLVNVELDALTAHKRGLDVDELMALLDKVAQRKGEGQEEALRRVCAMAAQGRIP